MHTSQTSHPNQAYLSSKLKRKKYLSNSYLEESVTLTASSYAPLKAYC